MINEVIKQLRIISISGISNIAIFFEFDYSKG